VVHAPARVLSLTDFLLGFVRGQRMRAHCSGDASLANRYKKDTCEKKADASGTIP
jgi:hypothetical protein